MYVWIGLSLWVLTKFKRFETFLFESNGFFRAMRPNKFASFNLLLTSLLDICKPKDPLISDTICREDLNGSIFAILTIAESVRKFVFRGPGFRLLPLINTSEFSTHDLIAMKPFFLETCSSLAMSDAFFPFPCIFHMIWLSSDFVCLSDFILKKLFFKLVFIIYLTL